MVSVPALQHCVEFLSSFGWILVRKKAQFSGQPRHRSVAGWWRCMPLPLQWNWPSPFAITAFSKHWASLFGFAYQMFPIQVILVSITTLKIDLSWKWILQLYHLLLHKLVSFSLKYPAILDKCSLLKNNSSSLKASFLSSEDIFRGFQPHGSQSDVLPSVQRSERPWRVGQRLAGVSRVSPTLLSLSAMGTMRCPSLLCSHSCPGQGRRSKGWVEGAESKERAQLCGESSFIGA